MKRTKIFAAVTFTVLLLVLAISSPGRAGHINATYEVTVLPSFGGSFTDCFRFDDPVSGDLTIDLLFDTITYRHGGLDTNRSEWKAVTRSDDFEIMFFGRFPRHRIRGEALSEFGDTFLLSGFRNDNCSVLEPEALTSNPYRP